MIVGVLVCGLGGCASTDRGHGESPAPAEGTPWPSSGDALLDELRRLALSAPIDVLIEKRFDFVGLLQTTYPADAIAWRGVGRLAEATLSAQPIPDRRLFARWLAQTIQFARPEVTQGFVDRVATLRALR